MIAFEIGGLYEYKGNPVAPEVSGSLVMPLSPHSRGDRLGDERIRVNIISGGLLKYHSREGANVIAKYLHKVEPLNILGDDDDDCV